MNINNELSERIFVTLFITEPEDLRLIKKNLDMLSLGILIKTTPVSGGTDVELSVESITQLYLLGRFVGADRKRIYDLDF